MRPCTRALVSRALAGAAASTTLAIVAGPGLQPGSLNARAAIGARCPDGASTTLGDDSDGMYVRDYPGHSLCTAGAAPQPPVCASQPWPMRCIAPSALARHLETSRLGLALADASRADSAGMPPGSPAQTPLAKSGWGPMRSLSQRYCLYAALPPLASTAALIISLEEKEKPIGKRPGIHSGITLKTMRNMMRDGIGKCVWRQGRGWGGQGRVRREVSPWKRTCASRETVPQLGRETVPQPMAIRGHHTAVKG